MKIKMNILLISISITAFLVQDAVAFFPAYDPVRKCVENTYFVYDHNFCRCNNDGTEIICERDLYSTVTPIFHRSQLQNLTYECVPNRISEHRCQHCLCDESGVYATCVRTDECSEYDRVYDRPERCIPGSVFNVKCNGCICGPDGKAACTKLSCPTAGDVQTPQCVPDSVYKFECNTCFCSPTGEGSCNRMGCDPFEFWHDHVLNVTMSCKPKSIFDYDCHECVCGDDGNYAVCSGKSCPSSMYNEVKDTVDKCNPGMIFGKDCNVCVCGDNGKGVCTTFSCDTSYQFEYKYNNLY